MTNTTAIMQNTSDVALWKYVAFEISRMLFYTMLTLLCGFLMYNILFGLCALTAFLFGTPDFLVYLAVGACVVRALHKISEQISERFLCADKDILSVDSIVGAAVLFGALNIFSARVCVQLLFLVYSLIFVPVKIHKLIKVWSAILYSFNPEELYNV